MVKFREMRKHPHMVFIDLMKAYNGPCLLLMLFPCEVVLFFYILNEILVASFKKEAYNGVPKEIVWWVLAKKGLSCKYVDVIRGM